MKLYTVYKHTSPSGKVYTDASIKRQSLRKKSTNTTSK